MQIDTLRLFRDVAQRLSFAAVADDHDINPSSVSRTIGLLEADLGTRLFNRTTRKMTLTEAGAGFLRRVTVILQEIEEAREEAVSSTTTPIGTLRMTASVSFGERVIMPIVPKFRAAYPQVKLELMFTDANLDYVANGIDLGVRLGPELKGDLIATKLFDTRYLVCASPIYLANNDAPDTPSGLSQHSCALFALAGFRTAWTFRDKAGSVQRVPVSGGIATTSAVNLRTAALSGLGPALLPDWLVTDDLNAGALIDLFPNHAVTATNFETAAWLLYPSKTFLPLKVRTMIDFLKANVSNGKRMPATS